MAKRATKKQTPGNTTKTKPPKRKLKRDMSPGELMELAFVRSRAWNQPNPAPLQQRIDDPVFGKLRWEDPFWVGAAKALALGVKVALHVAADFDDPQAPTTAQQSAYAAMMPRLASLRPQIEKLIFAHYNAVKADHRQGALMTPARIARNVPDLKKPSDIWRLLSKPAIHVPLPRKKDPKVIMVDFDCTWDDEHGVRVVIRDGRARRVTSQDDERP